MCTLRTGIYYDMNAPHPMFTPYFLLYEYERLIARLNGKTNWGELKF